MISEDYVNSAGVALAVARGMAAFRPIEELIPSAWAEQNVRIPSGNAIPGFVRFRNAPHQQEPLDCVANPDCREITLMWAAQTGKTLVQLMAMGYFIDHDPQSQMMMQPAQGDLQTWLSAKFDPMVDASDSLSEKLAKPRGKGGVNNQRLKQYPGGSLMFSWSGSPKTMRGRSAPKIFADEVDGYERTDEGTALSLISQRAATFGDQRLLFKTSTPTLKGASEIETSFELGDKRRWFVDCPHCEHSQYFKWAQVQWQKDEAGAHLPDTAAYVCEDCGVAWTEKERIQAIRNGRWVAEKPFAGHASFHLPEMASLFVRLPDLARSFLTKKEHGDIQTFINVSLAETWDEEGQTHDPDLLYLRRENYAAKLPAPIVLIVAGVDVQDDRLEVTVWGFSGPEGRGLWAITHEVFRGDPGQRELWQRLDDFLKSEFEHESGIRLRLAAVGVDSGGHYTTEVYKFCKARADRHVYALKGSNQRGAPIVGRPTDRNAVKVNLYAVGTDSAKEAIFGRLAVDEPTAPGFVHFPNSEPMIDHEFFAQLTAEKRITTYKNGFPVKIYRKIRPRNEVLDILVYALAAVEILRPNFAAIAKRIEAATNAPEPAKKVVKDDDSDALSVRKVHKARKKVHISRPKKGGFIRRY